MKLSSSALDQFYEAQWGVRWAQLKEALLAPEARVLRWNNFCALDETPPYISWRNRPNIFEREQSPSGAKEDSSIPRCQEEGGLLSYYVMDPASVLAAEALGVQQGDRVLDMCAAPGGKTLILIESLGDSGELFANEVSPGRRERLKKVIQQYVPRNVRDRVWVKGQDGGLFGVKEKASFDRILLDAPCSGERHLLQNAKELELWKENRSKSLAQRQYALLTSALLALKPGGRVLYSTCAVSRLENDEVIRKLMKKKEGQFDVIASELAESPDFEMGESTEFGVQFLPDHCGIGPIYCSLLEKI